MRKLSNYIISPDGKLYHASDDYLQHWKYIKREKVNGKWKYYYHDDKVDKTKREYNSAKAVKEAIEDEYKRASDKYKAALREMSKRALNDEYTDLDAAVINEFHDSIDKQIQAERDLGTTYEDSVEDKSKAYYKDSANDKYKTAERKYEKAKRRYNKSVGHDVADFLNNSSDKIDKAKDWIDGLLTKKKK